MTKWLIAGATALIAVVAITGVAVALMDSGDNGDDGSRVSPPVDENDGGDTGIAPICVEGAIDCDDTIEPPADDVCIQIYPPPSECADPDEPVSNEPPIVDEPVQSECGAEGYTADCAKAAIALATEDLAQRLGAPGAITVESIEFVQWPDSCLGISKADVACAEVITPGFRVVLRMNEQTFEYHTDMGARAELVE